MIPLFYDPLTDVLKLARPTTIVRAADERCTITCTSAPADGATFAIALTDDSDAPGVLAYTDTFAQANDEEWTGLLDTTDTRLATFMTGKGKVTIRVELAALIDGEQRRARTQISIEQTALDGPASSESGPNYYNVTQIDAALALKANLASPTFTGTPAAPTAAPGTNTTQIATMAAVQAACALVTAGLGIKASVRVKSTGDVNVSSPGGTHDDIAMASGNRLMLGSQDTASQNGLYVWNGASVPLTRATDFDAWTKIPGAIVTVEVGTANHDTIWLSTADQGGTVGSTAITFTNPFAAISSLDTITGVGGQRVSCEDREGLHL